MFKSTILITIIFSFTSAFSSNDPAKYNELKSFPHYGTNVISPLNKNLNISANNEQKHFNLNNQGIVCPSIEHALECNGIYYYRNIIYPTFDGSKTSNNKQSYLLRNFNNDQRSIYSICFGNHERRGRLAKRNTTIKVYLAIERILNNRPPPSSTGRVIIKHSNGEGLYYKIEKTGLLDTEFENYTDKTKRIKYSAIVTILQDPDKKRFFDQALSKKLEKTELDKLKDEIAAVVDKVCPEIKHEEAMKIDEYNTFNLLLAAAMEERAINNPSIKPRRSTKKTNKEPKPTVSSPLKGRVSKNTKRARHYRQI